MTLATPPPIKRPQLSDYSLVGENAKAAVDRGLAEADWYQSPVPRDVMRQLLERRNTPAALHTILWFALLATFGYLGFRLWGTWWAIFPFAAYGVIYGSTSDSRWHESSHGTAFRSDWMNNALYEIASFMVMRESTVWRWSHTRHHSDTIIVGRDPEIAVPRPPHLWPLLQGIFAIGAIKSYFRRLFVHALGKMQPNESTYIPASARPAIYFKARICLLIYAGVITACILTRSILPLMFVGLPNLYGSWLMGVYGLTQHSGLAENVLDHRLNCRTVYMNFIHRYLYWNMGYHVEHHMFPLVPYHNLPRLHEAVKADMPTPYPSLLAAWREIIPAILRQRKDPAYYIKRQIPTPTIPSVANIPAKMITSAAAPDAQGWVDVADASVLERADALRFDHARQTYAVYRTADDLYCATDGICTHGNTHLATGLVKGNLIECPKHNGRFDVRDGSPQRPPVCTALRTYPVRVVKGRMAINVRNAGGQGAADTAVVYRFRVISNHNVATFIKELVLEPAPDTPQLSFQPGQYLQLNVPAFEAIAFDAFNIQPPYHDVWKTHHVYDYAARNAAAVRRNYSLACNPHHDRLLRFNVRIATPPRGQDCSAGVGSSYVWNLKPGDAVTAIGPFGDFLVKPTDAEMVYLGGGAGMAPLRSHLSYLFETLTTGRRVSYWYGARSRQELYYHDYFLDLMKRFPNFTFHMALSEPLPHDDWTSHVGNIHEVLAREYLSQHPSPASIEYYLCGPQPMIQAARTMLETMDVPTTQIAYDEF